MNEDPFNEVFVLSLMEGFGADEGEPMDTEPPPPCGGLARQVHRLDGSSGTPLGPIQGQTHRQDGQILHPRGRRAVQARYVRTPAAVHAHTPGVRALPGHPRGRVRPSRGTAHPRGQHIPLGLLQAYCGC
jgi:hypothetical protein